MYVYIQYIYIYMYIIMYACYVRMYVCVCMYVCMYIFMCMYVCNCVWQFPVEVNMVEKFLEPVVQGTLVTPNEYLGKLLTLCQVSSALYGTALPLVEAVKDVCVCV